MQELAAIAELELDLLLALLVLGLVLAHQLGVGDRSGCLLGH